ncbi:MAG: isocitrate lyase/PEP mutase family protein [Deltaproteobacteria bacterium]|nr:isocitrate lyase/PEP mutase family protein [Deltaproteobacteria bacterium]
MKRSKVLRELLAKKELLIVPAAYDALSAKIIEQAGFKVIGVSGYGISATMLGKPDVGLTTLTEVVNVARYIASAVKIPVFCDADTGYGNAINVMRTTEEFILAGVAGVHIEDQVAPKRCGHVAGKQVVSVEEAVGKYRAADHIRRELDPDFVLIARTDALGAIGGSIEEVIRRGKAYIEAGADVIFPDGITSVEVLQRCVHEIPAPIMYNMVGVSPLLPMSQLQEMGVAIVANAGGAFRSATRALWDYMQAFAKGGTDFLIQFERDIQGHPTANFHQFIGFAEIRKLEEEYLPSEEVQRKYAQSIGYQP